MRKVTKQWTTQDGTKIRICDMSDSHLTNAIRYICRYVDHIKAEIPYPNFNGEMAQYVAEGEYDYIQRAEPEQLVGILVDLKKEMNRRGLSI